MKGTMRTRMLAAALVLSVGCSQTSNPGSSGAQTSQQLPTGTLDQLLAPIALYPDALLAQVLMSAQDPPKVAELDKWLKANTTLKGSQLQDAAVKAGFDASFVALALFPQVVSRMAEQIAWTVVLGQSFTKDKTAVFEAIQKLRQQAQTVGTLKSTPQQEVETRKTSSGEQVIVIEPTNPQIVYVPQYNTQVVYTQPPSTTTVIIQEDNDPEVAIAAGLTGFTAGVVMGSAMNNHYYHGPYGFYGGAYMYNDAWDNYYDHREDAREDWMDHREDLYEERNDRLDNQAEQRTDRRESTQDQRTQRQENRQENRPEATQAQRDQARQTAQDRQAQGASTQRGSTERAATERASTPSASSTDRATADRAAQERATGRTGSSEARGYGDSSRAQSASATTSSRSGTRSDAFSGYSSGSSQRAASSRGTQSRSSSRGSSGGGGGRRR